MIQVVPHIKNEPRPSFKFLTTSMKGGVKKAIVLLSGGLDSATTLYLARKLGYKCFCLSFDYNQRHKKEIESAKKIARAASCPAQVIKINLPWKGSALLDRDIIMPKQANRQTGKQANAIPSTYVPARNIIFLSFALSFAEAMGAERIFIGANVVDFSGYPDCRPEFYRAFNKVILTGTKAGVEKREIKIKTPLIRKTKAQIIRKARQLGVPLALTWSCYRGGKVPCGECDSCYYRHKGFQEAGIIDPLTKGRLLTQSLPAGRQGGTSLQPPLKAEIGRVSLN